MWTHLLPAEKGAIWPLACGGFNEETVICRLCDCMLVSHMQMLTPLIPSSLSGGRSESIISVSINEILTWTIGLTAKPRWVTGLWWPWWIWRYQMGKRRHQWHPVARKYTAFICDCNTRSVQARQRKVRCSFWHVYHTHRQMFSWFSFLFCLENDSAAPVSCGVKSLLCLRRPPEERTAAGSAYCTYNVNV